MQDDWKGITGKVTLGGTELKGWKITPKSLCEGSIVRVKGEEAVKGVPGGHFRGTFELKETADTFIDMDLDQPRPVRGVKANVLVDKKVETRNANND